MLHPLGVVLLAQSPRDRSCFFLNKVVPASYANSHVIIFIGVMGSWRSSARRWHAWVVRLWSGNIAILLCQDMGTVSVYTSFRHLRVVRRTTVAYCSCWETLPCLADLWWKRSNRRARVGTLPCNLLLQSIDLVLDLLLLRIQILWIVSASHRRNSGITSDAWDLWKLRLIQRWRLGWQLCNKFRLGLVLRRSLWKFSNLSQVLFDEFLLLSKSHLGRLLLI